MSNDLKEEKFDMLKILHHITSGMKAYLTDNLYTGIDEMRQACGGASFLMKSGIPDWWAEMSSSVTFEGVNAVMYQQCSNLLLTQVTKVLQGKVPDPFFAYIGEHQTLLSSKSGATTVEQFMDQDHLQRALATRAVFAVM